MITTSDFKRGAHVLIDGEPYTIDDFSVQSPSARGAATLVRTKLRHVVEGTLVEKTFKGGEKFEQPDLAFRQVQYLYGDGESLHFMDIQSYDQFQLPVERLGDDAVWLTEGLQLYSIVLEGHVVGVNMPTFVEIVVDTVGAGARGDTASGKTLKDAELANGVTIKVPLFIDSGDKIVVDLRTREYVRRA